MLRAMPTPTDTLGVLTFHLLQLHLRKCLRNNILNKISYTIFNFDYKLSYSKLTLCILIKIKY